MDITTNETTGVTTIDGVEYPFECSCGEHHATIESARHCRKCWVYAPEGHCEEVIDLRHDGVVWTMDVVRDWGRELSGAQGKWPTLAEVWR